MTGFVYGDVSMSDAPTAGWSKNEPSSSDSRKSLYIHTYRNRVRVKMWILFQLSAKLRMMQKG